MTIRLRDRITTLLKADAHGLVESLEERSLLLKQYLREAEIELNRKRARLEAGGEEFPFPLTSGFVVFCVNAGVDWMWEETAVGVLGIGGGLLLLALRGAQAERAAHRADDAVVVAGTTAEQPPWRRGLTIHDAGHVRVVTDDPVLPEDPEAAAVRSGAARVLTERVALEPQREARLDHLGLDVPGMNGELRDQ